MKSKSLDAAVVCGRATIQLLLMLTNFVASCRHDIQSSVHSVAFAIPKMLRWIQNSNAGHVTEAITFVP